LPLNVWARIGGVANQCNHLVPGISRAVELGAERIFVLGTEGPLVHGLSKPSRGVLDDLPRSKPVAA
jgi:hypothetical protein